MLCELHNLLLVPVAVVSRSCDFAHPLPDIMSVSTIYSAIPAGQFATWSLEEFHEVRWHNTAMKAVYAACTETARKLLVFVALPA